MTATNQLPETPAGWILGTDCGYQNHGGFVKDCAAAGNHWSLTPSDKGGWLLARVVNKIAESSQRFDTVEDAVQYVG